MTILNAADYGVIPGRDITVELMYLIECAKNTDGEKTICFQSGQYYLDSEKCRQYMLYITNTVGDEEFSAGETPHRNAVPLYMHSIENLTVDGQNSVFIVDGKVTNIALENCKNIVLKNIEVRHAHPDMHELKVVKKSAFYVEYQIDKDTNYCVENGKIYFYGKDYKVAADAHSLNAHWIGRIRAKTPDTIVRVKHPLFACKKMCDLGNHRIRCYYPMTAHFKIGDRYYLFDVRRQFAGIFVNQCENVVLEGIRQRFNYSLALVLQDSKNVSLLNSEFAPEQNSVRQMASVADFIQVCMCRGQIEVRNNLFDGAGDDCLNVHGVHYKITDIQKSENRLTVRFMHPQSHGYNPLHAGDEIAFINPKTLIECGKTTVQSAKLVNEFEIELLVDSTEAAHTGLVIEDISACPNVLFADNILNRIITRGLLLTTRGKVVVENNHFVSTSMSGVLLSDDARSWYESGMCCDVTVRNNVFDYCGQTPILIKPENAVYQGAVHKNITIAGNTFKDYKGYAVSAKSSDNICIKGNTFNSKKIIKASDCYHVNTEK